MSEQFRSNCSPKWGSSEREIKVGSVWANGNGEATVVTIDKNGDVCVAEFGAFIDTGLFRATHRWVRDPEPEIRVGDWVIVPDADEPTPIEVIETVANIAKTKGGEFVYISEIRPCDPPPLHKALRELVEAKKRCRTFTVQAEAIDLLNLIADLYSKGER